MDRVMYDPDDQTMRCGTGKDIKHTLFLCCCIDYIQGNLPRSIKLKQRCPPGVACKNKTIEGTANSDSGSVKTMLFKSETSEMENTLPR